MNILEAKEKFHHIDRNFRMHLKYTLPTYFRHVEEKFLRLVSADGEYYEDFNNIFTKIMKKDKHVLKGLGVNFIGSGDTRVALQIDTYVFKIDHTFNPDKTKGNANEENNHQLIQEMSPLCSLLLNPILYSFPYRGARVLVYKRLYLKGMHEFGDHINENPFYGAMVDIIESFTNDISEMNIGFFDGHAEGYPLLLDFDSFNRDTNNDSCKKVNKELIKLMNDYPEEWEYFVKSKKDWINS